MKSKYSKLTLGTYNGEDVLSTLTEVSIKRFKHFNSVKIIPYVGLIELSFLKILNRLKLYAKTKNVFILSILIKNSN